MQAVFFDKERSGPKEKYTTTEGLDDATFTLRKVDPVGRKVGGAEEGEVLYGLTWQKPLLSELPSNHAEDQLTARSAPLLNMAGLGWIGLGSLRNLLEPK